MSAGKVQRGQLNQLITKPAASCATIMAPGKLTQHRSPIPPERCAATQAQRLFLSVKAKRALGDWRQIVGGSREANQSCGCAETNGKMSRFVWCKRATSTTNCNNNNRRVFYCCLLVLFGQFIVIGSTKSNLSGARAEAATVISVKVGKYSARDLRTCHHKQQVGAPFICLLDSQANQSELAMASLKIVPLGLQRFARLQFGQVG